MFKIVRSKPQPPKQPEEVKCAGCGFLAVKMTVTGGFVEVEEGRREKWVMPERISGGHLHNVVVHDALPHCFRRAASLSAEVGGGHHTAMELLNDIRAVVHKERECPEFKKWVQGHSPKEHYEMLTERALRVEEVEQKRKDRTTQWLQILAAAIVGALIAALL